MGNGLADDGGIDSLADAPDASFNGKSRPQKRQTMASTFIASAQ